MHLAVWPEGSCLLLLLCLEQEGRQRWQLRFIWSGKPGLKITAAELAFSSAKLEEGGGV